MAPLIPLALKFLGLSGIGRRGGIALLIGGLLLIAPMAIPALKAKIPFIGTEAKLERQIKKNGDLQEKADQLSSELDSCVYSNETAAQAIAALQNAADERIRQAEKWEQDRAQLIRDAETKSMERQETERAHQKRLADAIRNATDQCVNSPVPGAILECLRNPAENSCPI